MRMRASIEQPNMSASYQESREALFDALHGTPRVESEIDD